MPEAREPVVIAEIGCNHRGEFDTALKMIETASGFCAVNVIKFQKRCIRELLTKNEYHAPHPVPCHGYGESYGKHREALEFDLEQHRELQACCANFGVTYACSVWDLTSAREIMSLAPPFIKVPSASNLHFPLLRELADNFGGKIHISLGMTSREEEVRIADFMSQHNRLEDIVFYACTSGYPVQFEDLCLGEIARLKTTYGSTVNDVGFSGHHLGISADIAAFTLGARWIERHFTMDRTWRGTDHAASLEPDGLRRLARDLRNVSKALGVKTPELLEVEKNQREKLKKRVEIDRLS